MRVEQGKIEGSVVLDEDLQLQGMIVGSLRVPDGRSVLLQGTVTKDVVVDEGGTAVIHGTVGGSVLANGETTVYGVVRGNATGPRLIVMPDAVVH